jgi:hypothetical protein
MSVGGLLINHIEANANTASSNERVVVQDVIKTQTKSSTKKTVKAPVKVEKKATRAAFKKVASTPSTATPAAKEVPETAALKPDTMYVANQAIPYKNGGMASGQKIIDNNPNGVISTWGGSPVQNATDGLNTHFIGHNFGAFTCLFQVKIGDDIVVTNDKGQAATYVVNAYDTVDTHGINVKTHKDMWNDITGTQGGERITLQTCINEKTRLILFANIA